MLMPFHHKNEELSSETIAQILEELSELLPSQGPIDVFIHHNTLHGLEHLSFFEALEEGARIFDARAYLDENQYIDFYRQGRISASDLDYVLNDANVDPENLVLIKSILVNTPEAKTFQQIKWLLRESDLHLPVSSEVVSHAKTWVSSETFQAETKFLEKINRQAAIGLRNLVEATLKNNIPSEIVKEALWTRCLLAVAAKQLSYHSEFADKDSIVREKVDPFLIRFCEEYLDLGQATISMPNRSVGILKSFYALVEKSDLYLPEWLTPITKDIAYYRGVEPQDLLLEILAKKELTSSEAKELIFSEVLALKGWAGFICSAEKNPEYLHELTQEIKPSLLEYVTLRILLSDLARKSCSSELLLQQQLPNRAALSRIDQLFFLAYHLFTVVLDTKDILSVFANQDYFENLLEQILVYPKIKRQRILHLAYEENLYQRALKTLKSNVNNSIPETDALAQMVFCLDDREESIRRHLEILNPAIKTFGTAGFFGIDAIYESMSGEHAPYCPIVIKPTHIVRQKPKDDASHRLLNLQKRQFVNLYFNNYLTRFSGSILHGWLMTIIGIFSLFPMLFSILFPRLRKPFSKFFDLDGSLTTELSDLEIEISSLEEADDQTLGYTEGEMAERVANVLKTIGLIKGFSRLVVFYGHGSSSRNNPLRSAYDCGACGGRPGRMNARVIAMMFNKPIVRRILRDRFGIIIPEDTLCIGAYHNTCNDQIQYYDLDLLPDSHQELFSDIKNLMVQACQNNSLERCRRFAQISVRTPLAAFKEVNSRSQTLSEPRPEYGHAGNALCFVGKREETKNLFFDRRSFLVSYDSTQDAEAQILAGIMRAIVPVCGGINLEYFFSALDNEVYGAGSKLPHNIVSMLGLMNGTCSDLRTGLPQQMIEIHEPVRLLMVVSCQLEQLQKAIQSDPTVRRMVGGHWVRLVCWDKLSNTFLEYDVNGNFREKPVDLITLPISNNYLEKIITRTDNLDFLRIR